MKLLGSFLAGVFYAVLLALLLAFILPKIL